MKKPRADRVMGRAFGAITEETSYVSGPLLDRVRDCILDYVPAAKARGLNYTPVIFGLQKSHRGGLGLIACSEEIRRVEPEGLRINDDSYSSIDALLIAASLNRIFEKVEKDL